MNTSRTFRDDFVKRITDIDKEIACYVEYDADDKDRHREIVAGRDESPPRSRLPSIFSKMEDAIAYMIDVFAPTGELYQAQGSAREQNIAKAVTKRMNQAAEVFGHVRALKRMFGAGFKYNIGGLHVDWETITGLVPTPRNTGGMGFQEATIHSGNRLEPLDMYNTIWDISVPVTDVPAMGEFVARIKRYNRFRVERMIEQGFFSNTGKFLDTWNALVADTHWYQAPPNVFTLSASSGDPQDWSAAFSSTSDVRNELFTFIHFTGWIDPKQFGLRPSGNSGFRREIWDIVIGPNNYIVRAQPRNYAHGELPFAFVQPYEDDLGLGTKSISELLMPLQRLESYDWTIHQRLLRKSWMGITFYNKSKVDLNAHSQQGLTGGSVGVELTEGDDIRKHVYQADLEYRYDPSGAMAWLHDMMERVFPTETAKQLASLERATQYQAAHTVLAGHRRQHGVAKTVDNQAMGRMRRQQIYNMYENEPTFTVIDDNTGEEVEVTAQQLYSARIEFVISEGLRGIDRLAIIEGYRDIIHWLLQSPLATEGKIDVIKIIDHVASMMGDKTDFTEFTIKSAMDGLPPAERDAAYQLYQQARQQAQPQEEPTNV